MAAVTHGTFAEAGRSLGLNATTVARRVASLEHDVGVKLVQAHSRGVLATAEGEELCKAARQASDLLVDAERRVSGRDMRLTGVLRFATIDALAVKHADILADFSKAYPGISLEVSCQNRLSDLTRREADVALRFTNKPSPHLVGTKVAGLRFALYAGAPLIAALGRPITVDDINDVPWVAWDLRLGASEQEHWRLRHAPNARVAARVDASTVMLESVRQGLGIAFIIRTLVDDEAVLVPVGVDPGWEDPLWLLTHPDMQKSPKVRAFLDFVGPRVRAHHKTTPKPPQETTYE